MASRRAGDVAPTIVNSSVARIALYLAAQRIRDDGWRYQSLSGITSFYSNLGWKSNEAKVHLGANEVDNSFGSIGRMTFGVQFSALTRFR